MQYLNTHPDIRLQSGLRLIRIRYLLLIPLLLLTAFELSVMQLVLLTLAFGLGLSFVGQVDQLSKGTPQFNSGIRNLNACDGGSFPVDRTPPLRQNSGRVTYDGGSFERAHLI